MVPLRIGLRVLVHREPNAGASRAAFSTSTTALSTTGLWSNRLEGSQKAMTATTNSRIGTDQTHTMASPNPWDGRSLDTGLYFEIIFVTFSKGPEGFYWTFHSKSLPQITVEPTQADREIIFFMSENCKILFCRCGNSQHDLSPEWVQGMSLFEHRFSSHDLPIFGVYQIKQSDHEIDDDIPGRDLTINVRKRPCSEVKILVDGTTNQPEQIATLEADEVPASNSTSADKAKDVDTFLLVEKPTFGHSNNSHSIFLPTEGKIEISFHSSQFEFTSLDWKTANQGCPDWIECNFSGTPQNPVKSFTIKNTSNNAYPHQASFEISFINTVSGQLFLAQFTSDPTIVHRGSTGNGCGGGGVLTEP